MEKIRVPVQICFTDEEIEAERRWRVGLDPDFPQFDGDPEGTLYGRGCPPPSTPSPPRPVRINFTDEEVERQMQQERKWTNHEEGEKITGGQNE